MAQKTNNYIRDLLEKEYKEISNLLADSKIKKDLQNHCYLRIANDIATGTEWTKVVDKPYIKNATDQQLNRSVENLRLMRDNNEMIDLMNHYSLEKRKKVKPIFIQFA